MPRNTEFVVLVMIKLKGVTGALGDQNRRVHRYRVIAKTRQDGDKKSFA